MNLITKLKNYITAKANEEMKQELLELEVKNELLKRKYKSLTGEDPEQALEEREAFERYMRWARKKQG